MSTALNRLVDGGELTRRGYAVTEGLPPTEVASVASTVAALFTGEEHGFHSSAEIEDHDYRARLRDLLVEVFTPLASEILPDHEIVHTAYLVKFPDSDSAMGPHQDWTMVDETRHRSVNLWCPLVDVDETNGCLRVLPGSHTVLRHLRPSPSLPDGWGDPTRGLEPSHLTPVPMDAGQVLVTDHRLVHCSEPNRSDVPRPVVAVGLVPRGARLYHYFRHEDERVERFGVPSPDWFHTFDMGRRPQGARSEGLVPFDGEPMTTDELRRACRRASRSRWWPRPRPRVEERVGPAHHEVPVGLPSSPEDAERTFLDDEVEAAFVRDGAVLVDLLTPDEVAAAQTGFAALDHPPPSEGGPLADGFHTTIYDGREGYRRAVFDLIASTFEGPLDEVVVGHRLFFANALTKAVGGAAVEDHLDWTFVDERHFASVTIWCPLVATEPGTGALGVHLGSHRQVDFVRAVNHREIDRHRAVGHGAEARIFTTRPGQAVVMNNRCLHFSTPNHGSSPRVALAAVAAPRPAALHHYWLDEEHAVHRLRLDPRFYLGYQVGDDPMAVDGVIDSEVADRVVCA